MTNKNLTLLAGMLLMAVTPGTLVAEGGGEGGLFSINPGLSIWATIVFLMLLGILWRFAWGPLLEQVQAREDRIQGSLDESAAARDEAAALLAEHKLQIADARRQVSEIVNEGKAAGERVRKEIEEKARTEGASIVEGARREIERERDRAIAQLRAESVDLALSAAAKLMGERMDDAKDRELVVSFLNAVSKDSGAEA